MVANAPQLNYVIQGFHDAPDWESPAHLQSVVVLGGALVKVIVKCVCKFRGMVNWLQVVKCRGSRMLTTMSRFDDICIELRPKMEYCRELCKSQDSDECLYSRAEGRWFCGRVVTNGRRCV